MHEKNSLPESLRRFLEIRNNVPTPSLSAEERQELERLQNRYQEFSATVSQYHPTHRLEARKSLVDRLANAEPRELEAAADDLAKFDLKSDSCWKSGNVALMRTQQQTLIFLRPIYQRELEKVRQFLREISAIDLSAVELEAGPAIRRVGGIEIRLAGHIKYMESMLSFENGSTQSPFELASFFVAKADRSTPAATVRQSDHKAPAAPETAPEGAEIAD